ncbi:MAG TPA: 1,4-alpha-glucan branching protein GlgB [Acidimicrobiales bacterium]|nr:1,4-alpha-glucan branching protein GlgB [Acidimicrobiales bacterium]
MVDARPATRAMKPSDPEIELIVAGEHGDPHRVLGLHDGVVRAYRPDALAMRFIPSGGSPAEAREMTRIHPAGVFEVAVPPETDHYQLAADYGRPGFVTTFVFDDPYRAWPTLGELDLHLIGEGRHHRLWTVLGAHPRVHQGVAGVSFAVWAPNARAARVVGDWNFWDGRVHQMRSLGSSGVWELFIPGVEPGARYKYELVTPDRHLSLKADPLAFATEVPPGTASIIAAPPGHAWSEADERWRAERAAARAHERPLSVYEMHLGSWRWGQDAQGHWRPLTYRELADRLPDYVADMGFTHVEFMPVAEHPYGGSWGYQVSAYYAPTARYGSPDDFRALVDALHQRGIGVIVDWVPAHFPRDEFALARFDGTALYEHEDPRKGSHPDWGTLVFNFGRNEVRNFLVANALFWLQEYHIDGLRVDAVASMLYLDYSRNPGEWIPNVFGGRENLEAVSFLKETNESVYAEHPGALMIAEESTAWPAVSRPTYLGGLGFGFKWNMGWMHDTLQYFSRDPLFRRYHQNELTFGLIYAWTENFVLPLSHDEVVHGKGSLMTKMPGDRWQQLAGLRALFGWMWAHPGKQLIFMGCELADDHEWSHEHSLNWDLLHNPEHAGVRAAVQALNRVYRSSPALWERDTTGEGFRWIDASDTDNSVLSFLRFGAGGEAGVETGTPVLACIANLTPVPHEGYRVGLPLAGPWREVVNTDAAFFGGSGMGNEGEVAATATPWHGLSASAELTLPPLAVIWLEPVR